MTFPRVYIYIYIYLHAVDFLLAYIYTNIYIYLGKKEIYCIFKTYCIISVTFFTKCCSFHNFIFFPSYNTHIFYKPHAKISIPTQSLNSHTVVTTDNSSLSCTFTNRPSLYMVVDCVWNVIACAQKPDFVFRRNGRVHLNRQGASVQSTTGSRGVHISGSNAGYTVFWGSVKGTGYPLHSPVSPSLPLLCVTVCHHISAGVYFITGYKWTSPFKSAGASVQSTTGSRGAGISSSNAGYTMFWGSVKSTGYPLHSPVFPSLPLPCITACHHISTGLLTPYIHAFWNSLEILTLSTSSSLMAPSLSISIFARTSEILFTRESSGTFWILLIASFNSSMLTSSSLRKIKAELNNLQRF